MILSGEGAETEYSPALLFRRGRVSVFRRSFSRIVIIFHYRSVFEDSVSPLEPAGDPPLASLVPQNRLTTSPRTAAPSRRSAAAMDSLGLWATRMEPGPQMTHSSPVLWSHPASVA